MPAHIDGPSDGVAPIAWTRTRFRHPLRDTVIYTAPGEGSSARSRRIGLPARGELVACSAAGEGPKTYTERDTGPDISKSSA